ncbi:MAG: ABC transporter ATP-binding protein [Candidatus Firestonebacteria bacterium]
MSDNLLVVQDVHKIFKVGEQAINVLKGISLTIKRGEIVTILGPSGAGKSTLLNILDGISTPTFGRVFLNGVDIYNLNDKSLSYLRNIKIGFVFQFYNLLPEFTTLENVILPSLIARKNSEEKGKKLLEELGLKERLNHKPGELSGGEQQRVALARALINNPDVLLADEPTGNLDSENANNLFELILKINEERGQTVVLVTHNEEFAKRTKRIVEMKDGKIV